MSTLATFGASKDHARERAGVLSGGPAVGRLSGLGLARMPEGGTRKNCVAMSWRIEGATVVESYPGMVVIEGNGTAVITAGPSDVVVRDGAGLTIARIPGCSERAFTLEFPFQNHKTAITIEALEGGGGTVFSGYRPVPALTAIEIEPVALPGTLVIDGKRCFIQGIHQNVVVRVRDPYAQGYSHAGRWTAEIGLYGIALMTLPVINPWWIDYYGKLNFYDIEIGEWKNLEIPIKDDPEKPMTLTLPDSLEYKFLQVQAESGAISARTNDIGMVPNQYLVSRMTVRYRYKSSQTGEWSEWSDGGSNHVYLLLARPHDRNPTDHYCFFGYSYSSDSYTWSPEWENGWNPENPIKYNDIHELYVCTPKNLSEWLSDHIVSAEVEITRLKRSIKYQGDETLDAYIDMVPIVSVYSVDPTLDYNANADWPGWWQWITYHSDFRTTWRKADTFPNGRRFT